MFNLSTLVNWKELSIRKQKLVDKANLRENRNRVDYDYKINDEVYIKKEGIFRKLDSPKLGPFQITEVVVLAFSPYVEILLLFISHQKVRF